MNQKFPYILRISEKAKHVRFRVSVEKGLEVVVPKRFSASRVPSLVEKNSQWIERAFQKAKAFQGLIDPMPVWQMPEEITSLALGGINKAATDPMGHLFFVFFAAFD